MSSTHRRFTGRTALALPALGWKWKNEIVKGLFFSMLP